MTDTVARRMTGTVIRVFLNNGFGFIRDSEGMSRFFYCREVRPLEAFDRMHEGQQVTFMPSSFDEKAKGNRLRAIEIELIPRP